MLRKLRVRKIAAVNRSGKRTNLPASQDHDLLRILTQRPERRTTSELFELMTKT